MVCVVVIDGLDGHHLPHVHVVDIGAEDGTVGEGNLLAENHLAVGDSGHHQHADCSVGGVLYLGQPDAVVCRGLPDRLDHGSSSS
jgi:hypothetical protein